MRIPRKSLKPSAKVLQFPIRALPVSEPAQVESPKVRRARQNFRAKAAISKADDKTVTAILTLCSKSEPARVIPIRKDSPQVARVTRCLEARSVVGITAGEALIDTVLALGNAEPDLVDCCRDLLASAGSNLELAKRSMGIPPKIAEALLLTLAEIEEKVVDANAR